MTYSTETEAIVAHLTTLIGGSADLLREQSPTLKFYDITMQFELNKLATTAEDMMQKSLTFDACSFTINRTGIHILLLVSQVG